MPCRGPVPCRRRIVETYRAFYRRTDGCDAVTLPDAIVVLAAAQPGTPAMVPAVVRAELSTRLRRLDR